MWKAICSSEGKKGGGYYRVSKAEGEAVDHECGLKAAMCG